MAEPPVFTYSLTKDEKVLISWHGKQVTILKGDNARKFIKRISGAPTAEARLVMARATGNFKRGNERK